MLAKWLSAGGTPEPAGADETPTENGAAAPAKPRVSPIDRKVHDGIRALEGEGNRGLLERIINLYLTEAPRLVEGVLSAAEKGDTETLLRGVHTLKSSSANVGATGLSDLCRKVEATARAGETIAAGDPLLSKLEGEHRSVLEALAAVLEGAPA
jgi:HPt (histidine-containing phosphotransfer) domain-containing protein